MVHFKKIAAFIFSVITVVSLSSCDNSTAIIEETTFVDETSSIIDVTDTTEYKFDEEKLFEVNSMDNLLKMYSTVKIIDKHDGSENIQQFFLYEGKTVYSQKWIGPNGNTVNDGWIKGYFVDCNNGEYSVSVNVNEIIGDDAVCPYEGAVVNSISEYEFELIEEAEDSFILNLNFEGKTDDIKHICTVDKKTHVLKSVHYETGDGYVATTEFVYGDEVDDFGITQGFDDTKTVTVNVHSIEDGKEENNTYEYIIPSDWVFTPVFYEEYMLYSNAEYTQIFEYPGHGEDYTIYATNLKG